jgi:hypothetical protein
VGDGDSYESELPAFPLLLIDKWMCIKFCFQIITKILKKRLLSVCVIEIMTFQRSKVLDVDDDIYPIS